MLMCLIPLLTKIMYSKLEYINIKIANFAFVTVCEHNGYMYKVPNLPTP